jgi:N-acetylneuraminate synthase
MNYRTELSISGRRISINELTYFIADIAANHDGDLSRAKDLIWRAKEAGADCAKFQHFLADKIVSSVGFSSMGGKISHQSNWDKSVVEVYEEYHTRREWTAELVETCRQAEIDFMTTPYDLEAIDTLTPVVPAFKIGSGDITYHELVEHVACIGKPIFLATGASTVEEVIDAVELILSHNEMLCLMQCNTNYTGDKDNFQYVNLNVLRAFSLRWPGLILGLSDHTPGYSAVIGAVALGARVIEKHFTDDSNRVGPDHGFALDPVKWRAMVTAAREVEQALGDGVKRVEANELETVVIQRRALRLKDDLAAGAVIEDHHLEALRPCPKEACSPNYLHRVVGRRLVRDKKAGEAILWKDLC